MMYETLKMMRQIITGKEKDTEEKELIKQYKESQNPNILAYFYIKNFGMIQKADLTNYLSSQDKASFCLQELDKCLYNYNLENDCLFSTYFIKCFKNRLRMEREQLQTLKRKANILIENIYEYSDNLSYTEESFLLDNYNLTEREKEFCKLKQYGYNIKEISNYFKLSISRVYKINNEIKQKLLA